MKPPVTGITGGTSSGNPDAGADYNDTNIEEYVDRSKTSDKAGAWTATGAIVLFAVAGTYFLVSDALEGGAFAAKKRRGKGPARKAYGDGEKVVGSGANGDGSASGRTESALESIEERAEGVPRYKGGNVVT